MYKGEPVQLWGSPFITSMLSAFAQPSVLVFSCAYKRLASLYKVYFLCFKVIIIWHSKILFPIVW